MKKIVALFIIGISVFVIAGCTPVTLTDDVTYTVSFDSNGGSAVPAQKVSENQKAIQPNTPVKDGYTFVGWYLGEEEWKFIGYSVTGNITLTAKWQINQYTITFDSNGGNPIPDITQDYGEIITKPIDPTKEGYTFDGWYLDNEKLDLIGYSVTENIILTAKWRINQYTISFNTNGGNSLTDTTEDYGEIITKPVDPTKEGYTFGGWYIDSALTNLYTFSTMPAEDIILYAKWDLIYYNIVYILDGGINENNPSTYTIEAPTIFLNNPTKEGYTFNGWFDNAEFSENVITEIPFGTTESITLYAKWTINQYTVTYVIYDDYDPLNDIPLNEGEKITSASLGYFSSSALTSEGRLFTWGFNGDSQLGDGTTTNRSTPTEITSRFNLNEGEIITNVLLGGTHSSAITSEGRFFTWGDCTFGSSGNGSQTCSNSPEDITSHFNLHEGERITSGSLGTYHSSAITSEGRIFTWGYNEGEGLLGDGTTTNRYTPTDITSRFNLNDDETITYVSLGSYHALAITSEGRVFTWGRNDTGQLGDGTRTLPYTQIEITSSFNLNDEERVVSASLGGYHSSVLTSEGRIFTWGRESQLGFGTLTPTDVTTQFNLNEGESIIQVSLGGYHSSAITSEGRIFTWGSNSLGRLGDGTNTNRSTPTEITSRFNLDDTERIVNVSLGLSHSSAITSEGRIFTWGTNNHFELGDGTNTNRYTPIEITSKFIYPYAVRSYRYEYSQPLDQYIRDFYTFDGWYKDAILTNPYAFSTIPAKDITLYGKWDLVNYNIIYNLDGGENENNPSTYTIKTPTISLEDPIKEGHTFNGWFDNPEFTGDLITEIRLGTTRDITLFAKWTINQYSLTYVTYVSNASLYDTIPGDILLNEGETIVNVSLGLSHSSAITSEGRIFTWGYNSYGQLGDGTTINRSTPTEITSQFILNEGETITSVSLGYYHSSAITSEGRIFTWGDNSWGQLGDGTTINRSTPTEITNQFILNEGETITSVSLGYYHSSAITSEGRIFTWGGNPLGQLGDGTTINRSTPTEITSQFILNEGEAITEVSLGYYHNSSAITSEGRMFTWGNNDYGMLGDGTTINRSTPTEVTNQFNLFEGETIVNVSLAFSHASVITSEGRIFTWGDNDRGQLGDGTVFESYTFVESTPTEITRQFILNEGETITEISVGSYHSSAITSEDRIFTWGYNYHGQLGDGTTINRSTPTEITSQFILNEGETITEVSLGSYHSSAITSEGRIFTWGTNQQGLLGDGANTNRSTPTFSPFMYADTINTFEYMFNQSLNQYIPVREGYTFDGWYTNPALTIPYIFSTMPGEDIIIYGRWIQN